MGIAKLLIANRGEIAIRIALTAAELFEVDNVIDPADTRHWIIEGLRSAPPPLPREGKKHAWIDTW